MIPITEDLNLMDFYDVSMIVFMHLSLVDLEMIGFEASRLEGCFG